ncbi:Rrf2 family transcriptional regulator [Leptolyngbya sp. FACHB-261]|uniref:RrF2 family transcriptional regulator n=1 Tax=Leptolyngbya sp. FACHB-261 TaxID=2692806 RepID=UPI001689F230|nr:Rrf2 family transcriptional regulator [Leptolyngbya sp. FACHB-261]MBD2102926.1 Rrf2 family transcriptional regulator [Leptolyngbya sp. FACHB-261]
MELSCKSEYALLALFELASKYKEGEPLQIRQIAAKQDIPDRYLEQLLATLRRGGIVRSQRGARGGYLLAREPWAIDLLEIVQCIEGIDNQQAEPCGPSGQSTSLEGTIVREVWHEAQLAADAVLKGYTLHDLCEQRNARHRSDLMYYI